jgi:DNA invertase Pin-like site-specific DNA recombinase
VRAAIYTRISRDRDGQALGVARQEKICRDIAATLDADVVEVFTDNDVSATSAGTRPGFERLLDCISEGRLDVVIALDSDRLLRKLGDLARLFELTEKHAVRVVYEHGGFDPRTGDGMFEASMRASIDGEEVRKLKKRVNRKNRELAEAGKAVSGGGDRPFGFEEDRRTHRPDEAALIRELAVRLLAGETIRGLCNELDQRGITTSSGGPWHPTTLKRVMTSARTAGLIEYRGEFHTATDWEPIISRDDLMSLRAKLNDPKRLTRHTSSDYLLTGGLARCGLCGEALISRPNSRKQRCYVCATGAGLKGCGKIRRLADPVEDLIVEAIFELIDDPKLAGKLARREGAAGAAAARESVEAIEAKQKALADAWATDKITDAEWQAARGPLAERLEAAERALSAQSATRAVDEYLGHPGALRKAWPDLSRDRRRAILGTFLRSVTILPAVRGRNTFDPSLIVPDWIE